MTAFVLAHKLREALEEHRFVLHYQPKVSLANGELEGFEAPVVAVVDGAVDDTAAACPVVELVDRPACLPPWPEQAVRTRPATTTAVQRPGPRVGMRLRSV